MMFILVLFVFIFVFVAEFSFAESSNNRINSGSSVYKNTKQSNKNNFKALLELEIKALSYAEASNVDNNFQQQIQLELNLKKTGSFFNKTNLILGTFSQENSFYYALPEAYVGFGSAASGVTVGRKTESLSFADAFFNLGIIQAYSTNDNINFIMGGLTGISGQISNANFGVIGTYMPIFIPNQGPQIKIENGQVLTSNRWAPQPPSKFKFGSEYSNINYAIRDYKMIELISNSGFMLNVFAGKNKTRPVFLATIAKKPINEIAFSRDTYSNISNFEGYVLLTPEVLMHELQAVDLNLDYENLKTSFSFLSDQPENKVALDLETIQTLNPLSIYSFFISLDLSANVGRKFEVYSAMAVVSGGEIKDLNSAKKESATAVATSRTQFKRPIRFGVKNDLFYVTSQAVEADLNMTYDQVLKGSLLSAQIKYAPIKNLHVSLGADIIGVENELPENSQGNFLDQNQANDRFFAGVNYVF